MDFAHTLGLNKEPETTEEERGKLQLYINLKLASSGQPTSVPGMRRTSSGFHMTC